MVSAIAITDTRSSSTEFRNNPPRAPWRASSTGSPDRGSYTLTGMAATFNQPESDQLVLRRSPDQRRKMLLIALPLMLAGFAASWIGVSRDVLPLMLFGALLLAPMLWVFDQGYVEVQLTPEGLTIRRAGSRLSLSWDEVESFYLRKVPSVGGSGKIVSVNFRNKKPAGLINRRALAGYIGSVGMDPDEEVELLETWRRRHS